MQPTHITFWNIPLDGIVLYPLAAVTVFLAGYVLVRRIRRWKIARGAYSPGKWGYRTVSFIKLILTDGLGHRRFLRDPYPGIMHFFIFWGFIVLFAGTLIDATSHYGPHYNTGNFYLTTSLILDILGLFVLIGVGIAAYRRYVQRPGRLDNQPGDAISLALVAAMVITGYLVEGARLSVPEPSDAAYHIWSPAGMVLSGLFDGLSVGAREGWHRGFWYLHVALVLGTISYVSLSANKLSHIVISTINTYFRPLGPKTVMQPIDIEKAETMGVGKIEEFRWKDMLDLDSCTRCGRCQDNCPAHLSGKALSPKKVIQDLKGHWRQTTAAKREETAQAPSMIGDVIAEQVLWDCTSCRSCEEQCPVYIEPVYKIMEMRRYQALMAGKLPDTAQTTLRNMQQRGHPWAGIGNLRLREDWAKEAGISKLSPGQQVETLLWVGCTGALVDRNVKVTLATTRLLRQAGVDFGVLGGDEICCGDPARRLGYELQFQEMAQKNIESFREHGIKRIVTPCPHCMNAIKNEYPQFGGDFEVLHHSQFLADLLDQGKLKVGAKLDKAATYHDPCYLGRYNDAYSAPRRAISRVFRHKVREMERSRWKSFCCGGGGGHMWMEEVGGKRINDMRCDQVMETGAQMAVTACPFCLQMLETGMERKGVKESFQITDIAEAVELALEETAAVAAKE
ncbi:MAG: heterodisulfide reductase-related iron-sulfur binding cluster [Dehalococcoidia bacterium]|nr:heterodisulfide reductase-related iron-sulfur binding cluster [Dehalococcoidia bacterium]